MASTQIRRALISVYDKTGIVDFAGALSTEFGIEILSTGGTAKLLRENDVPVTLVEEVTGVGEMLDGRVKTLHPKIHAAILADRNNPEHMKQLADAGIEPIDMVVVNLYPFEETVAEPACTFEQAMEMIDIGGPCLLRAAAKNHKHVLVVNGPHLYGQIVEHLRDWSAPQTRADALNTGAVGAFMTTAEYDESITSWLSRSPYGNLADFFVLRLTNRDHLRYGENPHQQAQLCQPHGFTKRSDLTTAYLAPGGGELSYNNYLDANAALRLCTELTIAQGILGGRCACVFIKHTNACGAGVADDPIEAYRRAYLGDPSAALGGILACNFAVTPAFAKAVMNSFARWGKDAGAGAFFVEVWVAPSFDEETVKVIRAAKAWGERVRLLGVGDMDIAPDPSALELRSITGGVLRQTPDTVGLNEDQWKVVTKRPPTKQEMNDLRLAWLICKHTKSNAVSICKEGMLIGNGAGQMSRVMSCRLATWLAKDNGHADKLPGSAAASDAFFPFRDGPDLLADAGVTAIIQPGGSKRDAETIAAGDERDIATVFTGTRHFKH